MMGRIAWRNLWRNRTRTAIVASAIAISYGLMLFMFGVSGDSYEQMGDSTVAAVGGHILVHGEGYWDLPTGGQKVSDPGQVREAAAAMPQVQALAERVMTYGLISTAEANEGVQIMGVRPEDEGVFYDLESRLVEGAFFGEEVDHPAVIGIDEAQTLGVGVGDRLVVTATAIDGEVTRGLFYVAGLLEATPGQVGEGRVYVELDRAGALFGYEGGVTQVGLRLHDEEEGAAVALRLKEILAGGNLEVLTFEEAIPELAALMQFDAAFSYLYIFVIMVIVVLGITNTFLMAVMERVREIGLLSALGLTPRKIGAMIVLETAILTGLAMTVGFLIGLGGHLYMVEYGIDLGAMMDLEMDIAGISLDFAVIRSHLEPGRWLMGTVVIFLFICASSAYPAWRATRMAPSEAMRFYE